MRISRGMLKQIGGYKGLLGGGRPQNFQGRYRFYEQGSHLIKFTHGKNGFSEVSKNLVR